MIFQMLNLKTLLSKKHYIDKIMLENELNILFLDEWSYNKIFNYIHK